VHLACRRTYFEADEILNQSPVQSDLSDADREEMIRAFDAEQADPSSDQRTATPALMSRAAALISSAILIMFLIQLPVCAIFRNNREVTMA